MKTMKVLFVVMVFVVISACQQHIKTHSNSMEKLVTLMSGQFDSLKQSKQDESYYNISLKMRQIWPMNTHGKWFYVEQAVATMMDKPYRQRVYHLTALSDGGFSSAVYELPDAISVVGAYENSELLSDITPADLKIREGCAVILYQEAEDVFSGKTKEKSCLSQLRGASYATSQVTISRKGISSWDQGFDSDGVQVWGAEKGPYVFDRK